MTPIFKIVLNGDSGVGKSSLILRLVDNAFSDDVAVTPGSDYKEHTFQVDGQAVRLQLWDTAGQERYRIITSSFYHNAHGTIIVYDVANKESFENVARWSQEVDRYLDIGVKVVVGNKSDLAAAVTPGDPQEVCDSIGAAHYVTSAKTGAGVREMFEGVARELLRAAPAPAPDAPNVVEVDTNARPGCCVLL